MLISLVELKASHQNFLYTSEKKCALLQLMLYFLKIRTFNDLKKSVNFWCVWAKQKYWMKYKGESFKHEYENTRHWVVIPAFGFLAALPIVKLAVVELSLSQSVCGFHCQSHVWSTGASMFNINFDSKGFLPSPQLLTSTFEYIFCLFFLFKSIYFLEPISISIEIHNFILFLLHKILWSIRRIIYCFSDT